MKGIITKYPITITARSITGNSEVRLRRELQTVAVPVFQFGVFSETDLTFYAGDNFDFGGRVHTNGNLFLSNLTGKTLTFTDRITAVREVVRAHFSNGLAVGEQLLHRQRAGADGDRFAGPQPEVHGAERGEHHVGACRRRARR